MPMVEAAKSQENRSVKPSIHPRLWTADEFLEWLQPDVRADLINGQRYMHSPASFRHARLLNTVDGVLRNYIAERDLGTLYREVIAVRFNARNVFEPDLMYFTPEQEVRLLPTHAPFAPTFIVEALSKRTAKRDTGLKFAAYERFGVQEYWVLDPINAEHRFYAREGEILVEFSRNDEIIRSRSIPGFYLRRACLNPEKPPSILTCLREILGQP